MQTASCRGFGEIFPAGRVSSSLLSIQLSTFGLLLLDHLSRTEGLVSRSSWILYLGIGNHNQVSTAIMIGIE